MKDLEGFLCLDPGGVHRRGVHDLVVAGWFSSLSISFSILFLALFLGFDFVVGNLVLVAGVVPVVISLSRRTR